MILVSFSFFSPLFFSLVEEGKKSCLCYFKKEGGVSQDRRRLSSSSYVTFTLPTLVNTLMQRGNLWNLCMKNEDCKKKKPTTFKRNKSLHVYYASFNEQRKPSETSWSTQENFRDNYIHSDRAVGSLIYLESVSSTNSWNHRQRDSSLGFSSFFWPPVIIG